MIPPGPDHSALAHFTAGTEEQILRFAEPFAFSEETISVTILKSAILPLESARESVELHEKIFAPVRNVSEVSAEP